MVGHTGVMAAAVKAAEAVDVAVGEVAAAVEAVGGALLVTADHGNLEMMRDPATGQPHTAHTVGPVPLVYVGARAGATLRAGGALRDVAPTLLDLLGLPQPVEMTGKLVDAIGSGRFDVIICNIANPDMVGHSGDLQAAILAAQAVDVAIGAVEGAVREAAVSYTHLDVYKRQKPGCSPFRRNRLR